MYSDLEARIARVEQLLPHLRRRTQRVSEVAGATYQALAAGIRVFNDGEPRTGIIRCGSYEVPITVYFSNPSAGVTNVPLAWTGSGASGWVGSSGGTTYTLTFSTGGGGSWLLSLFNPSSGGGSAGMTESCSPSWSLSNGFGWTAHP